jgi:hypothetical protein
VVDATERARIRDRLMWAVRFIAAEPDFALALIEREHLHVDELALALQDSLPIARQQRVVGEDVLAIVAEIEAVFAAMTGGKHADQWTDVAVRSGAEWAAQRERARTVLRLMGVPRADDDLAGHI